MRFWSRRPPAPRDRQTAQVCGAGVGATSSSEPAAGPAGEEPPQSRHRQQLRSRAPEDLQEKRRLHLGKVAHRLLTPQPGPHPARPMESRLGRGPASGCSGAQPLENGMAVSPFLEGPRGGGASEPGSASEGPSGISSEADGAGNTQPHGRHVSSTPSMPGVEAAGKPHGASVQAARRPPAASGGRCRGLPPALPL